MICGMPMPTNGNRIVVSTIEYDMKALLTLLALYLFPCTALGCATWLIVKSHPWWAALLVAIALITLPKFGARR